MARKCNAYLYADGKCHPETCSVNHEYDELMDLFDADEEAVKEREEEAKDQKTNVLAPYELEAHHLTDQKRG